MNIGQKVIFLIIQKCKTNAYATIVIIFRALFFIRKIINRAVPMYLNEKLRFNRENQNRILRNANDIELTQRMY